MGKVWNAPNNLVEMFELALDREVKPWLPNPDGPILNLGCGTKMIRGARNLDLPNWDAEKQPIPAHDEEVAAIYAIHFLEHVSNPIEVLRECQRVLMPGGILNIGLPYYSGQAAYQDLDHKSFWCEETWRNTFDNPYFTKGHEDWKFDIGCNMVMALVERNMALITQLIKRNDPFQHGVRQPSSTYDVQFP